MMMDEDILDSELLGYMNPLIKKVDTQSQYDRWFTAKQNDSTVVERIKNQDQFHRTILGKLHEANISIISGTDAGIGVTVPGFSIHQELAFYKESGLSNYEVLKTATVNPSKTHAIFNNLGTIQEGKLANILILESNPLMDIAALERPAFVFIKGRQLNRTTLDNFEQKAMNRNNLIATGIRYIENLLVEK
jgi:adenine deaminase